MKTSVLKKLIALMTAIMLLGTMLAFTVSADDGTAGDTATTPTDVVDLADLVISEKNVEIKDVFHLAFTVVYEGTVGLCVYAKDAVVGVDAPLYATNTLKQDLGGKIYLATQGIAAQDIKTEYKIVPVLIDGEEVKFGTSIVYSVAAYCEERLADKDELAPTSEQIALYNSILALGNYDYPVDEAPETDAEPAE